jgi:hypothetical protein
MERQLTVRLQSGATLPAVLKNSGASAAVAFDKDRRGPGAFLLLAGDRDYHVALRPDAPLPQDLPQVLGSALGTTVLVRFQGRPPVRRVLRAFGGSALDGASTALPQQGALDLTAGRSGAPPLYLLPDGRLSNTPHGAPTGAALLETLVTAARWVSARRTTTFECLFPPSAFHPDEPARTERLTAAQGQVLLAQLREALQMAAPDGPAAAERPDEAAQLRSAVLTVLSHLLATVLKDPSFRQVADAAAAEIFALIDRERDGGHVRPALRAHAIYLLQLRGPALSEADRERARQLLHGLIRKAPPYDELPSPWRFAMCSAWDFHEGEVGILKDKYGFRDIEAPADLPPGRRYHALEAPFRAPDGGPIQVFARAATPRDENEPMGQAFFTGVLINRHAQLGSFDMQAATSQVTQVGYKLMMNSQCAGLTTRFAISKVFPEADIYSSWDSTYFNTGPDGQVTSSEGLDCFVALLQGMAARQDHAQIEARMKEVQWYHKQAQFPGFVQFIGPANPQVVGRYEDVNQDGRADFYDGFLDFFIKALSEDLRASSTPRDPGVPPTQIGGEAAQGLGWAAGSLNRVVQYSDLWAGLPDGTELLYPFHAGGFFSHREPPMDVPVGRGPLRQDLGRLPAVCRYVRDGASTAGLAVDVMFHSHLAHAAEELKRLLCAADAMWRAFDLGYLPARGALATPAGQRGMLLLTLAGLLEFPSDQNFIDGLWGMALHMLNLPPISRSVVRACITEADHDASNYYGSLRGLRQLVGDGGALRKADPVAFEKVSSPDPSIGRARELDL